MQILVGSIEGFDALAAAVLQNSVVPDGLANVKILMH